MKTIRQKIIGAIALPFAFAMQTNGQTAIQFTAIRVTDEGAIHLEWASQSNHVYKVQCADTLIDTNTGTITWQTLYDDYPSQGTNTMWLDTGNYLNDPVILHPKNMPMRFYQIVDEGADTASDEPSISIGSPTSGSVVSDTLTIFVSAATDQAVIHTKLYVDGQEMQIRLYGTNYFDGSTNYIGDTYAINTCEWGNGPHVLFATAETYSTPEGLNNAAQPLIGHGVSPFVSVTFSNLITRVSFSQYFFDPDAGQTQQVSSVFAANCDWTLNVIDIFSNVVRTATGSGSTMLFSFDGNDNSGTSIPAGVYYYVISAQTNGQAFQSQGSGGGDSGGSSPPSPSIASASVGDSMELFAMPSNGAGAAVPLILYPPGYDTNSFLIFEATPSEMMPQQTSLLGAGTMDSATSDATPMYSGAASQSTTTPTRRPTVPAIRIAGTVGVGYQRYLSWTNQYAPTSPDNGLHIGQHIQMEGIGGSNPIKYHAMGAYEKEAKGFISVMQNFSSWKTTINKVDDNLKLSDLQGQSTPFNGVNLGLLLLHGTYGTGIDYAANGCEQMYFPIASGGGATYLRMSDMNFGGGGANGLKWMAIMACYSLQHDNWANMQSLGVKPYNANLHLLLGCDTTEYADPDMLAYWARYMAWGITNNSPMQVRTAWYQAAKDAYAYAIMPSGQTPLVWAVAGDNNCYYDTIKTNYNPAGSWFYEKTQIWPYQ
jgi:Family of unknown function (DUF6345)